LDCSRCSFCYQQSHGREPAVVRAIPAAVAAGATLEVVEAAEEVVAEEAAFSFTCCFNFASTIH